MPDFGDATSLIILWAVIGYLLGSIPTGLILARAMNLGNLREIGSGNTGATNVLRTGNKKAALLTLLIDMGKGALAVILATRLGNPGLGQLAGLAAFLGHCFSVWVRFRGGKGVATYFGVLGAVSPVMGAVAGLLWIGTAAISRYSSLAALVVAGWIPVIIAFTDRGHIFLLAAILGALIYIRHAANISRLRAGTEGKIGGR